MNRQHDTFRDRVIAAAEAALKAGGSVGPLELFQHMGLLHPVHVKGWRKSNELLMRGIDRLDARALVRDQIDRVLARWFSS